MILKQIQVENFRNFNHVTFSISKSLTLIVGENARGKTNLLEAIYFVINRVGFREKKEEELINFVKNQAWVEATFNIKDTRMIFRILLKKTDNFVKKEYFINKTRKKNQSYQGEQTKAILFSPDQINIITGSPYLRRDYFDKLIFYYDHMYKTRLINYENALRKRNKVLESYHEEHELKKELVFWNSYLQEQAEYIIKKRQEHIDFLNQNQKIDGKEFEIEYLKNELTQERLDNIFEKEKRWRQTLIGPQKDDFRIYLKAENKKDMHLYGSRSEQRLAVFWLKINEVKYYQKLHKKKPIILLDEIFAELDVNNIKLILNLISQYQTVITTTEIEIIHFADTPKSVIRI